MNCKPGDVAIVVGGLRNLSVGECHCQVGKVVRVVQARVSAAIPGMWLWRLEERLPPCKHSIAICCRLGGISLGPIFYPDELLRPLQSGEEQAQTEEPATRPEGVALTAGD